MADIRIEPRGHLSEDAAAFERDAAVAIDRIRAEKHARGLSYSVLDPSGRVVHVHPDGTRRSSRDPNSEIVG